VIVGFERVVAIGYVIIQLKIIHLDPDNVIFTSVIMTKIKRVVNVGTNFTALPL